MRVSPPPRAGIARSQSRTPGGCWRPPTTITGSQVEWMPRVRGGTPMGLVHAHTRASGGQSGSTSRRALDDVLRAHPA